MASRAFIQGELKIFAAIVGGLGDCKESRRRVKGVVAQIAVGQEAHSTVAKSYEEDRLVSGSRKSW
jgi:hypothetical protein